jgi:rsbT co-antagonist protein RsbR
MTEQRSRVPDVFERHHDELLAGWLAELADHRSRQGRVDEGEQRRHCDELLRLVRDALRTGAPPETWGGEDRPEWDPVRGLLTEVSASRARQGASPSETATFVFALKRPITERLRRELASADAERLSAELWSVGRLIDRLGLFTAEVYQRAREEVIARQQAEMLELSTPVIKLWDGVLALPLIGTLDSARTQVVMESLLNRIVETGSSIAILDITGVPTVDTLVAQHLIKTVTAARLMGADCIISGIRPQIAQTIVHLGVDLSSVVTKANLADAFTLALGKLGLEIRPAE